MQIIDLARIKELVDVPGFVPALISDLEEGYALYSEGKVEVPPVGFLHFPDPPGDVHIKYGYIRGDSVYVLKVASGFHDPTLGITASDGLLLVFSQKTGTVQSILLDECYLTDVRTAAGGAVAARHLGPREVTGIGIVGTGAQARMQLRMLPHVVECDRVTVWGRNQEHVDRMIRGIRKDPGFWPRDLDISGTTDMDRLTAGANLIVTATPAKVPLILADQVRPGTHITAMGSDDAGKQELDAALLGRADVVVADSRSQCVHHGEISHAVEQGLIEAEYVVELGQVIREPSLGRTRDDQITVIDQTGVAVQDIQIAKMVTQLAASGEDSPE
jgi:ornithine cyclodeaminase